MRRRSTSTMTISAVATVGLLLAPIAPAFAQAAPQADPPARVGQLAFVEGAVSTRTLNEDHWDTAALNFPVTSGDAYWTQPQALAELAVDSSSLWMNSSTEFDVNQLDLHAMQATVPQGELYLHLRNLAPGDTFNIQTPRGAVGMAANGHYGIVAGDTDNPTTISVLDGAAQITGQGLSLQVQANQTVTVTGAQGEEQGHVGPFAADAFFTAMRQRERPPVAAQIAPPPVVAQMTGTAELDQYGSWQSAPDYGSVWYPQVDAGWVPYREGHWAYVAPWGWTWIDNAPWGFAPFHYGRWVQINNRWGWTPVYGRADYGPSYTPVYAPALVTFFGIGAAAAIGVGIGAAFSGGNVGWVPLGPRDPYYPPYHTSSGYFRNVNVAAVPNIGSINRNATVNNVTINNYHNYAGATVVPAAAMAASRPVAAARVNVAGAELAQVHPVFNRPPIAPTAQTVGLTPVAARQFNVPLAARPAAAAPGPVVRAAAEPGRSPTLARPVPEAVRPAVAVPGPRPEAHAPGPPIEPRPAVPGAQAPALRPPVSAQAEPTRPAAPRPVEAARPAEAPRPTEAARPPAPPRPAEAARPVEPPHPGEAARPAEAPRPTEAVRPPAPSRPAEAARPVEPPHPVEAARPAPPPRPEPARIEHAAPPPEPHPEVRAEPPPRPAPPPRPEEARAAPPRPAPPPRPEEKKPPG